MMTAVTPLTAISSQEEDVAERLRRDNYDQFNTLVRMHLSFVLDLHTDDNDCPTDKSKLKKWNLVPFGKRKLRGVMDGAPLTQEGICQAYQLIEFLKKEQNITVEGVFRRTGSLNRQQELRGLLNQGLTLNLESGQYSVHDCASVLKGFLSELPEPLLTEAHYPAYCQIAELCGLMEKPRPTQESRLLCALQLILLLLPAENKLLLRDLLELLHLTASYEPKNKMSADSLATLFTPHLLCPRKLSPETLHTNSQTLSGIVSFMITKSPNLFEIPQNLAVDIKAYYTERERRKASSPQKLINESISDNLAANTVFSFVDHERTAKENLSNPTETALAQLYAHIQSMPESSKKRKLVKQFNKENGHGTPLQVLRSHGPKNKSFGDSIKKHIFSKKLIRSGKKAGFLELRRSSDEMLKSPQEPISRIQLLCTQCDSSDVSSPGNAANSATGSISIKEDNLKNTKLNCWSGSAKKLKRSLSESDLESDLKGVTNACLTSTPACHACPDLAFTPQNLGRQSMSPISKSTQRMCLAMQETMMTPRSRKPVLLISGTNITKLPTVDKAEQLEMNRVEEENSSEPESPEPKKAKSNTSKSEEIQENSSLSKTFQDYLCNRSILTASPTDLSFSSRTDDYNSSEFKNVSESKMNSSLLYCLDGNVPDDKQVVCEISNSDEDEKELVLKPKQYDENGQPIVYETSF